MSLIIILFIIFDRSVVVYYNRVPTDGFFVCAHGHTVGYRRSRYRISCVIVPYLRFRVRCHVTNFENRMLVPKIIFPSVRSCRREPK